MKNNNTIKIITNTLDHEEFSNDNYTLKEIVDIALSCGNPIQILLNNEDITESAAQYYCDHLYDENDIPEFVLDSEAYKVLEYRLWEDVQYGSYEYQHRLRTDDVL